MTRSQNHLFWSRTPQFCKIIGFVVWFWDRKQFVKKLQKCHLVGFKLKMSLLTLTSYLLPREPRGTECHFALHDSSQQNSTQYHRCPSGERASWLSGQPKPVSDHCFCETQARQNDTTRENNRWDICLDNCNCKWVFLHHHFCL